MRLIMMSAGDHSVCGGPNITQMHPYMLMVSFVDVGGRPFCLRIVMMSAEDSDVCGGPCCLRRIVMSADYLSVWGGSNQTQRLPSMLPFVCLDVCGGPCCMRKIMLLAEDNDVCG